MELSTTHTLACCLSLIWPICHRCLPGYTWANSSSGGHQGSRGGLSPAATAGIVVAVVVSVIAAAAVGCLVYNRKRRRRQQEQLKEQQLPQRAARGSASQDWHRLDSTNAMVNIISSPEPGSKGSRIGTGLDAAAITAAAAAQRQDADASDIVSVDAAGKHSSSSEGLRGLAHKLLECCPGSSAGTAGAGSSTCHSSRTGGSSIQLLGGGAAAGTAAAGTAAGCGSSRRGSTDKQHQQSRSSDEREIADQAGPNDSATVVVDMGEQLGKLAALHRQCLSRSDSDQAVELPVGLNSASRVSSFSQQQQLSPGFQGSEFQGAASFLQQVQRQWQRPQELGVLLGPAGQQQPAASTIDRLSQAITTVSSEMQLRRLTKATSLTSQATQLRHSSSSCAAAKGSAASSRTTTAAAAAGAALPTRPGTRLSVDESRLQAVHAGQAGQAVQLRDGRLGVVRTWNADSAAAADAEAAAAATAAAVELEGGMLVQQAKAPPQWPLPDSQQAAGGLGTVVF